MLRAVLIFFALLIAIPAGAKPAPDRRAVSAPIPAQAPAPAPSPEPTPQKTPLLPKSVPGFIQTPEASNFKQVCQGVFLENADKFKMSDMEKRLVCGDSSGGQIGAPWSDIPPNQAGYFLRGFLQTRGYHHPEFIQDGDNLYAKVGSVSHLTRFRILGGPESWDPPKRRLVEGNPLTPGLLDDLQGWAIGQMKDEGYPCSTGSIRADPETGEAVARLRPGEQMHVFKLEDSGDKGLSDNALNRYNAFRIGDVYRERLVTLTQRRIINDGFLQSITFNTRCTPEGAVINRDVVLGPSRTVQIGVGGSLQQGARVISIVKQAREGEYASSIQGRIDASYLNRQQNYQSAKATYHWYYTPGEARNYLEPSFELLHQADSNKEVQSATLKLPHGWNHEFSRGQFDAQVGPTLTDTATLRDSGNTPSRTTIGYAETRLRWTDHDYEYFLTSPRAGEQLTLTGRAIVSQLGANFTAQTLRLQGQKLWSVLRYDPPLFVVGWRFDAQSIFSEDPNISTHLPRTFLVDIGGDNDIRGFEPGSLPRNGQGALSGVTSGVEGRFHKILFRRVDLFTFVDAGVLGNANFHVSVPVFMSPGFGLRWESPVGALRGFVAQRFAMSERSDEPTYGSDWRFGATFGEEF